MALLQVENLNVTVDGKRILNGISFRMNKGEICAFMGPNGSGKSTLAYALMGHPRYKVESGRILLEGTDLTQSSPTDRAKAGLFLSFQYPAEIPGVSTEGFLRAAYNSTRDNKAGVMEFHKMLLESMNELKISPQFAARHINEGFSGGEKKKMEILQMSILNPKLAVLDETDSGLDVDSLRTVANGINKFINPDAGVLLITHYQRILQYVKPHTVHVMMNGSIAATGGSELTSEIEKQGYDWIRAERHGKLPGKGS
ncbi:Fe-S cluster assembly ATPase SufC [Candidatus Woesearchaeota archaeon]|nr:Fe-S cluster assembly ATPase SufC [Candidatus Woesearchaeota archaeon]